MPNRQKTISFGGERVDLTDRDTDELKQMDSFLGRHTDAEVAGERARGGTGVSERAQDYSRRQIRVQRELEARQLEPAADVGLFETSPTQPTDIGREPDGEFARPEQDPDIRPAPIDRSTETGRFGVDPFDLSTGVLASGGAADTNGREQFEFPDTTLSFARTRLNEKVFGKGRDDLNDLRQRVTPGEPLELDRGEFDTFRRAVSEGAQEAGERAERMDANIFGDTDEQAKFAREAQRGLVNNPPSFGTR